MPKLWVRTGGQWRTVSTSDTAETQIFDRTDQHPDRMYMTVDNGWHNDFVTLDTGVRYNPASKYRVVFFYGGLTGNQSEYWYYYNFWFAVTVGNGARVRADPMHGSPDGSGMSPYQDGSKWNGYAYSDAVQIPPGSQAAGGNIVAHIDVKWRHNGGKSETYQSEFRVRVFERSSVPNMWVRSGGAWRRMANLNVRSGGTWHRS